MKQVNQKGFTLIELIVVIVILGILAAAALPKFVQLAPEARMAKMRGASGAVESANAMIHAMWLNHQTLTTVAYEGGTITHVFGYPAAADIATVAGLKANDYTVTVAGGVATVRDPGKTTCLFTYTQATSALVPPVVNLTGITTANC